MNKKAQLIEGMRTEYTIIFIICLLIISGIFYMVLTHKLPGT